MNDSSSNKRLSKQSNSKNIIEAIKKSKVFKSLKKNKGLMVASGFVAPIILISILTTNYIYFYDDGLLSLFLTYTILGIVVGSMIMYFYTDHNNYSRSFTIIWVIISVAFLVMNPIHDTKNINPMLSALGISALLINYYALSMFIVFHIIKSLIALQKSINTSIRKVGLWVEIHPKTSPTIVAAVIGAFTTIISAIIGAIAIIINVLN